MALLPWVLVLADDDGRGVPVEEQDGISHLSMLKDVLLSCKVEQNIVTVTVQDVHCVRSRRKEVRLRAEVTDGH